MLCRTPGCGNERRKWRTLCSSCDWRLFVSKRPEYFAYKNLRDNAKRRKIEFSISMDYWMEFCARTNYHNLRGTGMEDMSIDRIDPTKGYVEGNIQMITKRQNIEKYDKVDKKIMMGVQRTWSVSAPKQSSDPF